MKLAADPGRNRGWLDKYRQSGWPGAEVMLMASTLAEGETILLNCAREPEVEDLADLLNKMGRG